MLFRHPLSSVCKQSDAKKKMNGLSPVNPDVIKVVQDHSQWDYIDQIIKLCKPIVDAIGNLESREVNLADCMLELLRCASVMEKIVPDGNDDPAFHQHAVAVFNQEFEAMTTDIHCLVLFLHPLCKKLVIHQTAKNRTYDNLKRTAGKIMMQWQWSLEQGKVLLDHLTAYFHGKAPFTGAKRDALEWWEHLTIDSPLKTMAITLFRIVPHSADVERLFSNLSGIQSVKHCNLFVEMMQDLGQLRAHYTHYLHEWNWRAGKPI
jgi:hypothetical protein